MTTEITKYLLTMCYHCDDVTKCETEEKCRACWAERAMLQEDNQQQELTTEQLLREYAL